MPKSLEQTQSRLEALIEINQRMLNTLIPDELLDLLIISARRLFSAEACTIAVIDENSKQLVFTLSGGGSELRDFRINLGQGIIGTVAQTGESVICRDVSKDSRFFSGVDKKTGFHTRSLLCAPLMRLGQVIGAIEMVNMSDPESLDDDDLKLLRVFGSLAGTAIDRARLFSSTQRANAANLELLQDRYRLIVGSSRSMHAAVSLAQTVAATNSTVLILGESGTGKEVLARAIHQWSSRAARPFIAVNCVAISPELMESELFGHERGAFTGAVSRQLGKFELAEGGTVFLDEIGDLLPNLQAKLLRVLQEREFQRVGGSREIRADVRIIAATNRDLLRAIHAGSFREDLYYRLNVVSVTLPPLREHKEDIPELVRRFIEQYSREVKRTRVDIEPSALEQLTAYSWRGNVRELRNAIERAVVLCPGTVITPADLPGEIRNSRSVTQQIVSDLPRFDEPVPLQLAVDQYKRNLVRTALEKAGGNQSEAARLLCLQRPNLSRLMKALGLR